MQRRSSRRKKKKKNTGVWRTCYVNSCASRCSPNLNSWILFSGEASCCAVESRCNNSPRPTAGQYGIRSTCFTMPRVASTRSSCWIVLYIGNARRCSESGGKVYISWNMRHTCLRRHDTYLRSLRRFTSSEYIADVYLRVQTYVRLLVRLYLLIFYWFLVFVFTSCLLALASFNVWIYPISFRDSWESAIKTLLPNKSQFVWSENSLVNVKWFLLYQKFTCECIYNISFKFFISNISSNLELQQFS